MTTPRSGRAVVTAFGEDGWGTIGGETLGQGSLAFHSTAIIDGSRTIEVGTRVRYGVVSGRQGRWEASEIEAI